MEYDFKSLHPEYGSGAPMWGRLAEFGAPSPEEIDFGVAEMKFRLAPEIAAALERHVTAGTFGYSGAPESLKREICAWMARRHGWRIEPEWLFQTYGLVLAVGCCVRALTEPGDGILLNYPSYPPFYRAIEQNGRRLVRSDLLELEGRYVFDFEDMERKIAQENVKLYILCSPQNPTGRVWTRTELERVGEMCLRHGVKVVSDEIHFDICCPGHEHSVFASLSDEFAANSVVLTAPSKTFNIAGMTISNVIIPSTQLRERVKETVSRDMGGYFNSFGYAACEAAYKSAEPWLDECLKVLEGTELKLYNANVSTLLDSVRAGAAGFSGVMASFHPELYAWLLAHVDDSRAEVLQAALTQCSLIERQLYPVNAKYHLQRMGLPLTTRSRTQDCHLLTETFKDEVRQMELLVAWLKKTLLAGEEV